MNPLCVVDLFCGAGGLSAGLMDSGMNVQAGFDHSDSSLEVYKNNLASHVYNLDLQNDDQVIYEVAKFEPDLIAGGPPCQDFSSAGKRTEGINANLTEKFGKIVAGCIPNFFLMENVALVRNSQVYKDMLKRLQQIGYQFSEIIIDASYYGVPQARKRFFAIGWKSNKNFGSKFASWINEKKSKKPLTVKEYLGAYIDIEYYYRHPRNYSRRSVFSVYEPSPTIRGVNRPVPPQYKGNYLDSVPPLSVRPLTSFERSQIQTFPRSWKWGTLNSNTTLETNIGNAVPVKLASLIGEGILYAIR